jgi:pyrroloquinoline quinone (PQQ) biosynthesis protein C
MSDDFFRQLDAVVTEGWDAIKRGAYFAHVREKGVSKELFRRTLVEIYHYTRHNSVNQALAVYRVPPERTTLLGFCYRHAGEELGHERMIVRDLESAGLLRPGLLEAPPLAPTQALVGYLYYVALNLGAVARLGYSYWAETAYDHIGALIGRGKSDLGLTDKNLTFFVAHAAIDEGHAKDVRDAILAHVKTPEERTQVLEVARTTLYLTGAMLDAIAHAHARGGES